MSRRYLTELDLSGNQLRNARIQNITGAPADIAPGLVWFDVTTGRLVFGNNTSDGAIDPTAREFHSGQQPSSTISDLAATVKAYRLNEFAAPDNDVDAAGVGLVNVSRVTGLQPNNLGSPFGLDPSAAVSVQDLQTSIDSVRSQFVADFVATTAVAEAGLTDGGSGYATVDGVALYDGARLLLTRQANSATNGLYTLTANGPVAIAVQVGNVVHVTGGTDNADTLWTLVSTGVGNPRWERGVTGGSTLNAFQAPTAPVSFGAQPLQNVQAGAADGDAVNLLQMSTAIAGMSADDRAYTDTAVAGIADNSLSDFAAPTGPLDVGTQRLVNVAASVDPTDGVNRTELTTGLAAERTYADGLDAATRAFVGTTDAATRDFVTTSVAGVADNSLSDFAAPTAPLDIGGQTIINVAPATTGTGVVNRDQLNATRDALRTELTGTSTDIRTYVDQGDAAERAFAQGLDTATRAFVGTTDAATRDFVTTSVAAVADNTLNDFGAPTAPLSLAGQTLIDVAPAATGTGAINRDQLYAERDALLARTLDVIAAPVAPVNLGGQTLTGLAPSANPTDAVSRVELDAVQNGTDWKESVRATSTDGVALTGLPTIDGVALAEGDRVLLTDQGAEGDAAENGIWIARAAGWVRAPDADQGTLTASSAVMVEEGTAFAGTQWRLATTGALTVGTTALNWIQFGAATTYTGGNGVELTGTSFSLSANVPRKFVGAALGDGAATSILIPHGLGTRDVTVSVFTDNDGAEVECDILRTSTNAITLGFAMAPAAGTLRCVVVG